MPACLDDEWWEEEAEGLDDAEEELVEWVRLLPLVDVQGLLNQGATVKLEACASVNELDVKF